ncbi:MAG: helix-turn-helix transcriptional regulator [Ruminococcaceae bacterium]|nr:helix-turn-helix transcriptional regulator [Oscillospiraceae bacterium]
MTLGEKIKSERLRQGLSQSELAGDKITRNMLSAIESDKANPSLNTLFYLAERLSVSLSYLFADEVDIPIQKKLLVIDDIKNGFKSKQYASCVEKILNIGFIDDELAYMLSVSYFNLGRDAVFGGSVSDAKNHFEEFAKYSDKTIYSTEVLNTLTLMYSALASNIQSPLLDFDIKSFEEGLRNEFDFEFYKYLIQDTDYPYNNTVFLRHLSAKDMIRQRKYSTAIPLLKSIENEKSTGSYNAYVIFGVYSDLENCYKQLADYENAYRYASKRISLIEAFK